MNSRILAFAFSSRRAFPNYLIEKVILPENLIEHDLGVVGGVPVAVVVEAAGLLEDAGQFHAARAHEVDVGLRAGVAVLEGALLLSPAER